MAIQSDFAWLVEHDQELAERYPGKWVAIWQGKVIAVGDDAKSVADKADEVAPPEEFILHRANPNVDVIYASIPVGPARLQAI